MDARNFDFSDECPPEVQYAEECGGCTSRAIHYMESVHRWSIEWTGEDWYVTSPGSSHGTVMTDADVISYAWHEGLEPSVCEKCMSARAAAQGRRGGTPEESESR